MRRKKGKKGTTASQTLLQTSCLRCSFGFLSFPSEGFSPLEVKSKHAVFLLSDPQNEEEAEEEERLMLV